MHAMRVVDSVQESVAETTWPPIWLTVSLICLIYGPLLLTLRPVHHSPGPDSTLFLSVVGLLLESLLVLLLYCGLHAGGVRLQNFNFSNWIKSQSLAKDIQIGIAVSLLHIGFATLLFFLLGHRPGSSPIPTPHGSAEIIFLLLFVVAAAIVEEFIFRGYFFQLLCNWTGSLERALILQAAAFSAAHGLHQTPAGVIDKIVFGLVMGWLANRRQSLVPGMIAHAAGNFVAVIVVVAISH
jgi:membrane protease YdiL (CAAX protease family)